jgi:hypothetical protein
VANAEGEPVAVGIELGLTVTDGSMDGSMLVLGSTLGISSAFCEDEGDTEGLAPTLDEDEGAAESCRGVAARATACVSTAAVHLSRVV